MTSFWVPAAAAVGASGLTGLAGFGAVVWNQRHIERSAELCHPGGGLPAPGRTLAVIHDAGQFTPSDSRVPAQASAMASMWRWEFVVRSIHWTSMTALRQRSSRSTRRGRRSRSPESSKRCSSLIISYEPARDLLEIAGEVGNARGTVQTRLRGPAWSAEQRKALQSATERSWLRDRASMSIPHGVRRRCGRWSYAKPRRSSGGILESDRFHPTWVMRRHPV